MSTLRDRLELSTLHAFIGRESERRLFGAALADEQGAFPVFYVQGPGGIGKSALLNRLAADARASGRHVVEVDGRLIEATPDAFEDAVGEPVPGVVLLIDTFERCQGLETWLSRRFLPGLPSDAIVVIAGRLAPDPAWRADPAWVDTLCVITLQTFDADESAALMYNRGVAPHLHQRLLDFTGGHPLGLSMAAEVATKATPLGQPEAAAVEASPDTVRTVLSQLGPDMIRTLVCHLVGEQPSEWHLRALAVCAHAEVTTEDLLRAVLPAKKARELFEWLRGLPYVEAGPHGVYPHDLVRNVLDADLRYRDPEGYEAIHQALWRYLLQRLRASQGADARRKARQFLFILRRSPVVSSFFSWTSEDVFGDQYRTSDRSRLLTLAKQTKGPELAPIVDYWLHRRPEAFLVCRRMSTGEPVAFSAWLRLTDPAEEDRRADPVVDAVWSHVAEGAGLRPGEYVGVSRFWIDPERPKQASSLMDLMLLHVAQPWLVGEGLAWSFCVAANTAEWRDSFAGLQHELVPAAPRIGSTTFGLYACDWRRRPVEQWLDRLSEQALSGHVEAAQTGSAEKFPVLSRSEFDDAVRAALQALRGGSLSANVLVRTKVAASIPGSDRTGALRQLLRDTIRAMANDPSKAKAYRVLDATFLHAPTQEVAANMLGLPFTTYRRHLARGIELLSELLWQREIGAAQ